jgi:multiple sugar transport system permease protein
MSTDTEGRSRRFRPTAFALDLLEDMSEAQFAYLMLTPLLLLLGSMAFWPLVRTFEMSLHADSVLTSGAVGELVGFETYIEILAGNRNAFLPSPVFDLSSPFQSALTVTLIFTALAVSIETVVGFGQALILNKSFTGRRWVRLVLILPWAVPIVVQGTIFFLLFSPEVGFIVDPLNQLGLISQSPLATSQDSLFIMVLADVWRQSAFMTLLILAGLQSIDRSLYDVAKIAGASRWQQFKTITFPLVLPALLVALLFRTIGAMKIYGTIETATTCTTVPSLSCLVVGTFNTGRYGSASTIAFIMAFMIGILLMVYLAFIVKSDQAGGI